MSASESVYERLPNDELLATLRFFERAIPRFLFLKRKYPADLKYDVSLIDVIDVIIQVDKRAKHYKYFHKGLEINEAKKIGIYIYWLLKFKPIRLLDDRYRTKLYSVDINERFALTLLYATLHKLKRDTSLVKGGVPYYNELRYSFRFRTFTAGATMVLADSFH
ncbi:hypothetical protein FACS1894190_00620 [Spirochaetia bacterium]|nr:hypothetical protein FACS1894190_00620 [Spirochaetia bacterium]